MYLIFLEVFFIINVGKFFKGEFYVWIRGYLK